MILWKINVFSSHFAGSVSLSPSIWDTSSWFLHDDHSLLYHLLWKLTVFKCIVSHTLVFFSFEEGKIKISDKHFTVEVNHGEWIHAVRDIVTGVKWAAPMWSVVQLSSRLAKRSISPEIWSGPSRCSALLWTMNQWTVSLRRLRWSPRPRLNFWK